MKRSLQIKKLKWPLSEFQKNINLLNIEIFIFILILSIVSLSARANNIQVSNVTLTGQVAGSHTFVQFDLSWDNSWRISAGPSNWDAAWIFVKFQITGGGAGCTASSAWNHATLSSTSADHNTGTDVSSPAAPATISAVSDTRGVFIYRQSNGSGQNIWQTIRLRWNYPIDGVLDACTVSIKVFAVEMVYVPQGNFFIGDGITANGRLADASSGVGAPFQITGSGSPITLGGTGSTIGSSGSTTLIDPYKDDFSSATTRILSAAFPNGFNNFYCMKYEISQEQYAEFLNMLTAAQQATRTPATTVLYYHSNPVVGGAPLNRNGVKCKTAPSGAMAGAYGCDLNNDNVFNDVNDGRYLAMNFLSAPDLLAYLDWSGLRPMTELEYEKACRGPLIPVNNEHAWGSSAITIALAAGITNSGADNETVTTAGANANLAPVAPAVGGTGGPLRCGVFAGLATTRVQSGASYYGIMELTGNVFDDIVGIGNAASRSYTGVHGNGSLTASGNADVDFWPGSNNNGTLSNANTIPNTGCTSHAGLGIGGGSFDSSFLGKVSERTQHNGLVAIGSRDWRNGGRGVRSVP